MATLFKNHSDKKLLGQIYTPDFIVKKILNDMGYKGKNILKKYILDSSCGDGRFLIEAARRIISESKPNELKENLSYLYGWDIDNKAVKKCKKNLNKLIGKYSISIDWNIKCCNTLRKIENFNSLFKNENFMTFDYIVGNPPYIRIQHLEEEQRKFIQRNYNFCSNGSTDIYIAFFEFCLKSLKKTGVCGLITPNTYFTTETAQIIRKYFEDNRNLIKITNYGDIQIFENATTYSAITIFGRKTNKNFVFEKAKTKKSFIDREVDFKEIADTEFWQLSAENEFRKRVGKKLKEICDIHCGLATLADRAYIMKFINFEGDCINLFSRLKGKVKIEKDILKPIIKASRLKFSGEAISEYILFPYKKESGKSKIISENELKSKYPNAYKYLCAVKNYLDKRCNGKPNPVAWYAYGRTQALDTSFGKKILFSPMAQKPNFIYCGNEETTFYSGYCIKYGGEPEKLLQQLNSREMEEFVLISGRDFRDGWKSYSKKIIQEFVVNITEPDTVKIRAGFGKERFMNLGV
ncbi:MAG: N-6 DNA methylase [Elusimicrobia bacterium HGW-Elusimicrobia-2]|nr:MAG: N-6 DNA methylase [Elusimicrobia bacterium HGW-Elusimicrobia-2]